MASKKPLETKFCQLCGTEFQGIKLAKFCSDKCKEQRKKDLAIMHREKKKAEAKKKKTAKPSGKQLLGSARKWALATVKRYEGGLFNGGYLNQH